MEFDVYGSGNVKLWWWVDGGVVFFLNKIINCSGENYYC